MVRVQDKFRGQNSTNGEVECIGENLFIKALFRISFDLKKKKIAMIQNILSEVFPNKEETKLFCKYLTSSTPQSRSYFLCRLGGWRKALEDILQNQSMELATHQPRASACFSFLFLPLRRDIPKRKKFIGHPITFSTSQCFLIQRAIMNVGLINRHVSG